MCNFRRHADGFPKRRMRMDRLANIHRVGAHFNGQRYLANHVTGMRADHAAAQNLAVSVRLRAVIKQQLGDPFVATIGDCAT